MKILFVLKEHKHWGLIPAALACDLNVNGELGLKYREINAKNKNRYTEYCSKHQATLLNCCLQLEDTNILSKFHPKGISSNKDVDYLSSFSQNTPESEYLNDFVNLVLNKFYSNLRTEMLYLPKGSIPSLWKGIYVDESILDVYYHFNYSPEQIEYTLKLSRDNKEVNLKGAILLSNKPARVLLGNSILTFPAEINGVKLKPFFSKNTVIVPESKVEEYLQKVILLLIKSRRVVAQGFSIEEVDAEPNAILQLTENRQSSQLSLFGNVDNADTPESMVFKLTFKYPPFIFEAGSNSPTVKLSREADKLTFYFIDRKIEKEKIYIDVLKELGVQSPSKLDKGEALQWIGSNYDRLQQEGIEIQLNQKGDQHKKYFIGKAELNIQLEEGNDWFDVFGSVVFGEYKVSLLTIIDLVRKNKREVRLPNGEYASIPQMWIDEYKGLFMFVENDKGKLHLEKHHAAVANELNNSGLVAMNISEPMRKFLNFDHTTEYDLPINFNGTLRPYQTAGYNWLRSLDSLALGACLADDMGLGKTIQTLCLLQWMKEQGRGTNLLVAPTSLIYNWELEAAKFTPELKVLLHTGTNRVKDVTNFSNYDVVICSYAILRSDIDWIRKFSFNYAIIDEAQAIKNPESGVAQACYSIVSKRYLSLTGTPVENSITDLWSQMNFTNKNMLGNKQWFTREFVKDDTESKRKRLNTIVHPFILRRLKKNVLTELPDKIISTQYCDMPPSQLDAYRLIKNEIQSELINNAKDVSRNKLFVLDGLLRMRQAANHPVLSDPEYTGASGKFDLVCTYIDLVIEEGNKVLIFSSFVQHLKLYRDYLEAKGVNYCYIDGSTQDRAAQVNVFQNDETYPVFLLSIKAGGTGLNLTRAGYVFLLDPWWNPAVEAQAFDRAHRIGQKNTVFVYKFITRNSVEEKILKLQESKLKLSEDLLTSEDGFLKNLDKESLEDLLS